MAIQSQSDQSQSEGDVVNDINVAPFVSAVDRAGVPNLPALTLNE